VLFASFFSLANVITLFHTRVAVSIGNSCHGVPNREPSSEQCQLRNTKLPVLNCAATTGRMKVFEGKKT
jgi:hypothetical protein